MVLQTLPQNLLSEVVLLVNNIILSIEHEQFINKLTGRNKTKKNEYCWLSHKLMSHIDFKNNDR